MLKSKDIDRSPNVTQIVSITIKTVIAIGSLYFIYNEISKREDIEEVVQSFNSIASKGITYVNLAIVVLLMLFNWALEARKWQILLRKIKVIKFTKAFISTLSGITVSFFTPNRMGEFLGRVLHLDPKNRIEASVASVLGSISQTIITIFIGAIAAIGIITEHVKWAAEDPALFWVAVTGSLIFFGAIYFRSDLASKYLSNVKVINRYAPKLSILEKYTVIEKMTILCYSLLRYIVFSLQFFILLLTMEVWVSPHLAFKLIATLFLVLTIIPGTALTELAVRGSVALALFGVFSDNQTGILAATFLIWFINLVIPAAMGTLSIYFIKTNKNAIISE
ncbi:MAG: hypothetical protein HKN22_07520 [Bacteroidia bacterium]|nr:hypothetical protein [Bacteroidia bacterium]